MKIVIIRTEFASNYTTGKLFINGTYLCDTLEDTYRGQLHNPGDKVFAETAIPAGKYQVIINFSNKFKKQMPLVLNVPNFSGIRLHSGNTVQDTAGCILLGTETEPGVIARSKEHYQKFYALLQEGTKKGKVTITILHAVHP